MAAFKTNRWALGALLERTPEVPSRAALARDSDVQAPHVTDVLNGRRDASEDLLHRFAIALNVDARAISADPFGVLGPLERVADCARQLLPTINGGDFGLRDALAELDEVQP